MVAARCRRDGDGSSFTRISRVMGNRTRFDGCHHVTGRKREMDESCWLEGAKSGEGGRDPAGAVWWWIV